MVSIIIPTYNSSPYIRATIESVINQSFSDWEIIIVDDCSNDDTVSIAKEFIKPNRRIKVIECEKNFGGPAKPRNIGLKKAKGEFIALLDSDDIWHPKKLEYQLEVLNKNPNIFVVCSDIEYLPKKLPSSRLNLRKLFRLKRTISLKSLVNQTCFVPLSSSIMRAALVQDVGYFEEDINFIAVEDYDYWLRVLLFQNNSIYYQDKKLIKYRIHESNISHGNAFEINYNRLMSVYKKHRSALSHITNTESQAERIINSFKYLELSHRIQKDNVGLLNILNCKEITLWQKFRLVFKF